MNISKFIPSKYDAKKKLILFGAGNLGILAIEALKQFNIKPNFFYDNSLKKQNKTFHNIKIINEKELEDIAENSIVILCNNYIDATLDFLAKYKFNKAFDVSDILMNHNFNVKELLKIQEENLQLGPLKPLLDHKRVIGLHANTYSNSKNDYDEKFLIKYLDIVVTERCSMKCIDCSNLMQYYTKPKNSNFEELKFSLERLMKIVQGIYEFRVIGGEPFINRELDKILSLMVSYEHLQNIVIYTNAQHIPTGNTLEVLKNPKIKLDITNYRKVNRSAKHDRLIKVLQENNINYVTHVANIWTDSGRVKFRNLDEANLKDMFMNCCVNDVLSLLNGKIYRCPFSANAHNLKAIPDDERDIVNISDPKINDDIIKEQLLSLYTRKDRKDYISACNYCGGRDHNTPVIKAATQTKLPISF